MKGVVVRMPAIAVVGAVLVSGLAACGGSSSGGSGGNAQDGGTATGPVQHPASLVGEVGKNDAFAISLADDKGTPITNLAAGTYKLTVHDDSGIHDFHLTGGSVNESTTVPEKATKTFTVTFKPGTYTFLCDPHSSQMHGSFKVS